jgi:hypothetical protein
MPEQRTIERARRDRRQGKAPSTQAGEFVREEIHHVRRGKHGARSTKQAIAIGLSKARRSGVRLKPRKGDETRYGQAHASPSPRRRRATLHALRREPHSAASRSSLSQQARESARKRGPVSRVKAALKAAETKGKQVLRRAEQRVAHTRTVRRIRRAIY